MTPHASRRTAEPRAALDSAAPGAADAPASPPAMPGLDPPGARPRSYSRWRAATLAGVYVLMAAHIVHWKLAGRTLAPLELNEVMYTLELGIVTAGFLFMALAMLATLVFGRFFCSWGCHILALEDLSAWVLRRLRIRPKPVRSRVLKRVPPIALFYMFVWPQIARLLDGRAAPVLHLRTDAQGWASFLTSNFWRNLPSPAVTAVTFFICGFAIVYLLGARAFCTYGCPYGAAFALADRIAPGRIIARGDCAQCGACTAACQSHIRVHKELEAFGRVVSPSCMKDLDCVAACPNGAVGFGFARPAIFEWRRRGAVKPIPFDFSPSEDVLMGGVFLAALFIFRGLYDAVPFLMTLAIGAALAYAAVLSLRLNTRPSVQFHHWQLKRAGRLTRAGRAFAGLSVLMALFVGHSAIIRYHEAAAGRALRRVAGQVAAPDADVAAALGHVEFCQRWGLLHPAHWIADSAFLHQRCGESLASRGLPMAAAAAFQRAAALQSDLCERGRLRAEAGSLLLDAGDLDRALSVLRTAAAEAPQSAHVQYNLAVAWSAAGHDEQALSAYERTLALDPADAEAHNNLGFLLARRGQLDAAAAHLVRAIDLKTDYADPYFNLARVRAAQGDPIESTRLFAAAAHRDPKYRGLSARVPPLAPAAAPPR
ncbi:MAG: tetratricopeptide repeat protein [Phycisphaerae bacterium]